MKLGGEIESQDAIERLCSDRDWRVRVVVVERVESQAVLERLCEDDSWRVRVAASDRLKTSVKKRG